MDNFLNINNILFIVLYLNSYLVKYNKREVYLTFLSLSLSFYSLCMTPPPDHVGGHLSSDLEMTWILPPIKEPFMWQLSWLAWHLAHLRDAPSHPATTTILKGIVLLSHRSTAVRRYVQLSLLLPWGQMGSCCHRTDKRFPLAPADKNRPLNSNLI